MLRERIRKALLQFLFPPAIVGFNLGEGAIQPIRKHSGDAGWDLFTSRDVWIPANSFRDVHTDLYLDMPEGVWCRITGRSSTVRKWGTESIGEVSKLGLEVIEGVIDTGYTGELFVGVINHSNKDIRIHKGDRLAQAIFTTHIINMGWQHRSLSRFSTTSRGSQGFGSTGRNGK